MSAIDDSEKIRLLFKEFTGVANANKDIGFNAEAFKFTPYVTNNSIFSNDFPDSIDFSFNNSGNIVYGVAALDLSYGTTSIGQSFQITNDLTYYHRLPLDKASGTSKWGYHKLDSSGNNILQDTIPFKYDDSFKNSYAQVLWEYIPSPPSYVQRDVGINPYNWVMDYQSGFVELLGLTELPSGHEFRFSFIKYTGPKGAAGGSGGGGSDASFNNVDISGDLNVANLTVTESASLPKDTLIQPIFYKVAGSNISTHPFFDKEYAQTQSYNALCLDPSKNLITTSDWITIARVGENISTNQDGRADALFKISHPASGRHETITFIASFKFAEGLSINVLQHDWYSGPNFKALRIMYEGTYDGAILQLKCTNSAFNPAGRLNPLQIYIKDDHDYPGWQQNTFDVSGSIILDGREAFYAVPNNNPISQGSAGVLFTNEFLLDDLDWNPGSGNANQITTNPARFTRQVDVGGNITTDSSVGATVNIVAGQAVQGAAGVFDGLTVNTDAEVGRFLTVNGDGYVSGFEKDNFNMSNTYLADINLYIQPNAIFDIKNLACKALFEIIVSDQNPSNFNSSRNQIIVGTITVSSSVGITSSNDLDFGLMVNIIHSSWCDRSSSSPAPLINKVLLQGQVASASTGFLTTQQIKLWIDGPSSNIPYISFKLKNNNLNQYGTPLPNLKFGKYFIANTGFGTSAPGGNMKAEAIIPSDKKSFTSLGADQVDIPNLVSSNLEIGDSNNNISFKAHQFTLSGVANNNWFTIARLGTDNTNSSAQNRGVAVIEIYNRQSVRHQCVRMFVSQIFDKGGSIEAYNVGYNTGGIQYQAVRIVTDSIYDGALLQVKAGPGIQNGVSYPHYVNLMLSTNEPGWEIIDDESVVNADNNPLIYSGPNNNGTNTYSPPSQGWTEISLLSQFGYTNTQGPRAYTGKVTTLPTLFQGARVQVIGENITAFKDNGGGNVGTVGGVVIVQDTSTTNDITMKLDPSGNGIISNTDSSNDKSLSLISDGNINISSIGVANNNNIILDNTTGGSSPFIGDIIGRSRKDIQLIAGNANAGKVLLQTYGTSANTDGIQLVHYNTLTTSTPYTMKWSSGVGGLSVGTHNIVDVKNILGDDNRSSDMTIRADSNGVNSTAKAVHITNPLRLAESSSGVVNSGINAQSYGTMAYDFNLNSIVCKPRSATSSVGPGASPFILTTPTVIRLMDYTNNYRTGPSQTTTYQRPATNSTVAWTTGHSWGPYVTASNFGSWDDQLAYIGYVAPHDGYLTHVEFGGLPAHKPASGAIWTINRTNFPVAGGQPTILKLQFLTSNGGIKSWQDIGDILTGPTTTAGTSTGINVRWEFDINPKTKKLFFEKGDALLFRVYWQQISFSGSGTSTDTLYCNVVNLGKSGSLNSRKTVFDLFATMVFIPKH